MSGLPADIDLCLDNEVLYQRLETRVQLGDFMMSVDSTNAMASSFVVFDEHAVEIVDSYDVENDEEKKDRKPEQEAE